MDGCFSSQKTAIEAGLLALDWAQGVGCVLLGWLGAAAAVVWMSGSGIPVPVRQFQGLLRVEWLRLISCVFI